MSRLAFGVAAAAGALALITAAPVAAASAIPVAAAPALPSATGPAADLVGTVTAKALERARGVRTLALAGPDDTRVTVARRAGADWAFGTAVVVAPHVAGGYPDGHLFLARRSGGGWQVALRGESAFADLAAGYVGIAYHGIGKWVFMNGGSAYQGYALHGSARVNVGGGLYNYGRLGMNQGIVDADGGGSVNMRSGPGTGYPVVGSVADGATVTISCSAYGTTPTGRWGTTSLWNRLTDGTWISDAFVWTGAAFPVNGWC